MSDLDSLISEDTRRMLANINETQPLGDLPSLASDTAVDSTAKAPVSDQPQKSPRTDMRLSRDGKTWSMNDGPITIGRCVVAVEQLPVAKCLSYTVPENGAPLGQSQMTFCCFCRSSNNTITVKNISGISRNHAEIAKGIITDKGSRNGTRVNGVLVSIAGTDLAPGDTGSPLNFPIRIGA
jgi:hypothetical protein